MAYSHPSYLVSFRPSFFSCVLALFFASGSIDPGRRPHQLDRSDASGSHHLLYFDDFRSRQHRSIGSIDGGEFQNYLPFHLHRYHAVLNAARSYVICPISLRMCYLRTVSICICTPESYATLPFTNCSFFLVSSFFICDDTDCSFPRIATFNFQMTKDIIHAS